MSEADLPKQEPSAPTMLGIRIPEDLRAKIKEAARLEGRTESSFARFYLSKAADKSLTEAEEVKP